ncbi:hypothetical protein N5K27_14005 [Pigmentiphaga sp. GD03639]|uniref:VapC45 PIN like domain-containing protein n=1 Tax=Pigmentiphaga daeguensis TaxID=414049 RepID=A0ABN1CAD0_9BURK|nr:MULTISPECIES: hypothetical protein [unclassified Pigmentiphaga]MDH2237412.1 hypothetical protein [Pigmentiphaga sp. GD03639]OVZ63141.1 hypothetical protein CDO46_12770 [Pigmentiphaga sp. NML030171]
MNFLLDNNLPPQWAPALAEASQGVLAGRIGEVCHLRSRFPKNTDDIVWLRTLGEERDWAILSVDAFRKKNGAERQVIRQYGLSVFVLQSSWSSRKYWDKLSQLVLWWPRIVDQANTVERAAVEVPWRVSTRFKQL